MISKKFFFNVITLAKVPLISTLELLAFMSQCSVMRLAY